MNIISNILYWISTGLLVPVVVLLIFFFIRSLFLIGAIFGQYMQHNKVSVPFCNSIEKLTPTSLHEFMRSLPDSPHNLLETYAAQIIMAEGDGARIELLLSEYEIEVSKALSTSSC